jgi:hypothetical protein
VSDESDSEFAQQFEKHLDPTILVSLGIKID